MGRVYSLALSADGRTAVSAAEDGTLRVWDVKGARPARAVQSGGVTCLAVSADNRTVVSGGSDRAVRVWDVASSRCRATLRGHEFSVESVAVSADGRIAVSGGEDNTVRVWDLASGQGRATLAEHTWKVVVDVIAVAVSADGRTAVSRSSDKRVRVWDLPSGLCRATHGSDSPEAQRAWESVRPPQGPVLRRYGHHLEVLTAAERVLARFPGDFTAAISSADGRHVISGDGRGCLYFLRLHSRED